MQVKRTSHSASANQSAQKITRTKVSYEKEKDGTQKATQSTESLDSLNSLFSLLSDSGSGEDFSFDVNEDDLPPPPSRGRRFNGNQSTEASGSEEDFSFPPPPRGHKFRGAESVDDSSSEDGEEFDFPPPPRGHRVRGTESTETNSENEEFGFPPPLSLKDLKSLVQSLQTLGGSESEDIDVSELTSLLEELVEKLESNDPTIVAAKKDPNSDLRSLFDLLEAILRKLKENNEDEDPNNNDLLSLLKSFKNESVK